MEEKDEDLMDIYCPTKIFLEDKSYLQNLKQHVVKIMSEYTYMHRRCLCRSPNDKYKVNTGNSEIERKLFLKFNINSEVIDGKGIEDDKIVEKNDELKTYFVVKKDFDVYGRGDHYKTEVILKPFIDEFPSMENKLCIFLKVISVFPPHDDEQKKIDKVIEELKEWLKDIYNIEKDKNAEYGYRVTSKHNIELGEATEKLAEKEPSLRKVLDFMYACDYVNALKELALLLEPKRKEYQEKIQKGNETLFDIDKFFNFVNNYGIRHNNAQQKQAKEEQLKVHLDFGLSIYRLFTIYGDL